MRTPVNIDYDNEAVFKFYFKNNFWNVMIRPEVYDWLKEHINSQGYYTKSIQGDCVEQLTGVCFEFEDPKVALMFKLAWSGL